MRRFKSIVKILLLLNLCEPFAFVMAATCLIDPLAGPVATSPFGSYRRGQGGTVHQGLDLVPKSADPKTNPLYAAAKGKIVFADFRGGGYGNSVVIEREDDIPGDLILYRHMRYAFPKPKGASVIPGDHIGYMGGTKNARNDSGYAPHLHLEYMTKKVNTNQYEFDPVTKKISSRFVNLGKKGLGDKFFIGRGLYYTDPSPYFCNTFVFKNPAVTGFRFKDTKEQYRFMMTKLGKNGGIVEGTPPSLGDYTSTQQTAEAEKTCAAFQEKATES